MVAATPGLVGSLARDRRKGARFYPRFVVAEVRVRYEAPAVEAETAENVAELVEVTYGRLAGGPAEAAANSHRSSGCRFATSLPRIMYSCTVIKCR